MTPQRAPDLQAGGGYLLQPAPDALQLSSGGLDCLDCATGSSGRQASRALADAERFLAELRSGKSGQVTGAKVACSDGALAERPAASKLDGRPCQAGLTPAPVRSAPGAVMLSPLLQQSASLTFAANTPAGGPGLTGVGSLSSGKLRARPNDDDQELAYLRRNIDHLRASKRQLEAQVASLGVRMKSLEDQNCRYRMFCEQLKGGERLDVEMDNFQDKLTAVELLKDALNTENIELQIRLESALENLRAEQKEQKHTQCVVCMDNLANVVCLPCKHLAICSSCGAPEQRLESCPICRTSISDRLQVFMP